jgi:hypothetical protein
MTEPMTEHTREPIEPSDPSHPVEAEPQDRCRACGARLTAGAPWCSLCFTPVAPDVAQAQPEPDDDTHAGAHTAAGAPLTAATDDRTPGDPAQENLSPDESQQDEQDGQSHQLADELMARLAAERPAPSRLSGLAPSSGLARAGVSVVGVVLVTGLAFGLMALLGSFL